MELQMVTPTGKRIVKAVVFDDRHLPFEFDYTILSTGRELASYGFDARFIGVGNDPGVKGLVDEDGNIWDRKEIEQHTISLCDREAATRPPYDPYQHMY